MATVIRFDEEEEHERAIDVLLETGETYGTVAPGCLLVTNTAIRSLRATGIRFRVLGRRPEEEEPNASPT